MSTRTVGRKATRSRIVVRLSACLAATALAAAVIAPAAGALTPYRVSEAIIPKTFYAPTGLAVDQETNDLYAAAFFGLGGVHRFDAITEVEDTWGEGFYESVAVNPVNRNIYALTKPPTPIRVEIYNQEGEIAQKPISTPAGRGIIGSDSAGNVFVVDIGAINEQQKFTVAATGGTYKLKFEGEETAPIEYNAEAFQVTEALAALPKIGEGNVEASRSGQTYTVNYQGALANTNVPLLGADSSGLSEGAVTKMETVVDGSNDPPTVKQYAPNGVLLQTIDCSACPGGPFTEVPTGVSLDDADNLYVGDKAGERVIVFHATAGTPTDYATVAPTEIASGALKSIAVDPVTHEVWVAGDDGGGFHIKGFEPDGTKFADVGLGFLQGGFSFLGAQQLAVNGNDGTVWISEIFSSEEGLAIKIVGFVPAPPPTIENKPATVIETSTSATMNGTVNPNGVLVLSCKFEYGPTAAYGTTLPCNDPGFGEAPVPVSAEATGLTPDTTYHYRIVATSETGTTEGPDGTFKTLIDKATASTGDPSAVAQTTATVTGSINPGGNPLTECRFEYGSGPDYGKQTPCASLPGAVNGEVPVSGVLTGLEPNAVYHYRLVSVNAGGTRFGENRALATLPKAPVVTTGAATKVGADVARIAGTVNPEGSITRYRFEYGPTAGYGEGTVLGTAVGTEPVKVSADLAGLQPGTTYHYRLVGTSAGGSTPGPDGTFTTGPRPIGRVYLPARAPLKGRKAAIQLQCRGVAIAECKGTLVLRARIKQGIRFILVKVGEADFDLFGGQKKVITVVLNDAGKKVIAQSGGKPIPAVASAANKNRVVRLSRGGR